MTHVNGGGANIDAIGSCYRSIWLDNVKTFNTNISDSGWQHLPAVHH